MIKQSDTFLQGEGREWLRRNKDKIDVDNDPVLAMIKNADLQPKRVLEIGCADGWRLTELRKRYSCEVRGVDPGASQYGGDHAYIDWGTADDLATCFDEDYDLVIYGFCLYLCDREDLFRIAMEGDRVLADKGHIIIWDFGPETPVKQPYKHKTDVWSYKMDYAKLWLANPAYSGTHGRYFGDPKNPPEDRTFVSILKKDVEAAWPQKSF